MQEPHRMVEMSVADMYALPVEAQHDFHLAGAKMRFGELRERLSVLDRVAIEQNVDKLTSIEDLGLLLFPHSAYKSYPMKFLEENRFDRITRWLDGFTTADLSAIDASACESIDDWVQLLDAQTDVRVIHSTGTSGKLSFLPRGTLEYNRMVHAFHRYFDKFGDEPPRMSVAPAEAPMIYCQYRHGGMAQHRLLDWLVLDLYDGDESKVITTHPGRFSADAASISGRLRVAEAAGELGRMKISPTLMARRDQFLADQENSEAHFAAFLDRIKAYRGRPVMIMASLPQIFNVAKRGLEQGMRNMFDAGSFIQIGGGLKGQTLPDDWRDTVREFLGDAPLSEGYGMTEIVGSTRACPAGNYHLYPYLIPFILDPATGEQQPRTGTQTGRFGIFDLTPRTYWGGFLTGDLVTLDWGDVTPCSCGRKGAYLHPNVRRLSEAEGGDDKVTCAGAPEAHDKAIDFILNNVA